MYKSRWNVCCVLMAKLLFPSGKTIHLATEAPRSLGRADICRYPEAVTVSRVQCLVEDITSSRSKELIKLTSKGTQNPTLVIDTVGRSRYLGAGETETLCDGDAFSLICTRPDLAIRVQLDPQTQPSTSKQQPEAQPGNSLLETAHPPAHCIQLPKMAHRDATVQLHGSSPASAAALHASPMPSHNTTDDGSNGPKHIEALGSQSFSAGAASAQTPDAGKAGSAPSGASGGGDVGHTTGGSRKGSKPLPRGVGNGNPATRTAPPVVLLLAGLPGSGKSTLSRNLLQASPIAWVHVNQDAIRDGRPGTRDQCVAAVRAALEEGACCVVDRCHADADQRHTFLDLAAQLRAPTHCVALQLPMELCARRVGARTDHPGGVQGDGSRKVVYQMARQQQQNKSWPPAATEGFQSLMDCHTDADTDAAVRAWALYGSDVTAASVDGTPAAAARAVAGAAAPGQTSSGGDAGPSSPTNPAIDAAAVTLAAWQVHVAKRKPIPGGIMSFFKPKTATGSSPAEAKGGGAAGTAAQKTPRPLPMSKTGKLSSTVTTPGVSGARGKDVPAGSEGIVQSPIAAQPAREAEVTVARGVGGAAVAGATMSAEMPVGSSGTRRAGEPLVDVPVAKRRLVDLPQVGRGSVPGAAAAGARRTGNVATPVVEKQADAKPDSEGGAMAAAAAPPHNAFAVLMSASHQTAGGRGSGAPGKDGGGAGPSGTEAGGASDPRFKLSAPWAQALRKAALNPRECDQKILYEDERVLMIEDAYPKARHHVLVIARDPELRSIADLRQEHGPLLAHMAEVARTWVQKQRTQEPNTVAFKLGFHAVPSMCQVHMHVISQDYDSPSLKNKKHWNSFNTRFFQPLEAVQRELSSNGRVNLMTQTEEKELEGQGLSCHACKIAMKTMPQLKKHIAACDAVRHLPGL